MLISSFKIAFSCNIYLYFLSAYKIFYVFLMNSKHLLQISESSKAHTKNHNFINFIMRGKMSYTKGIFYNLFLRFDRQFLRLSLSALEYFQQYKLQTYPYSHKHKPQFRIFNKFPAVFTFCNFFFQPLDNFNL